MYNPMLGSNPMMQNPMMQNPMMQNPMMQNPMMQNPMMQNPMMGMPGYPNQMSMLMLQTQLQQLPQMLAYVNQLQQQLATQQQEIPVSGNMPQPQTQFPVPNPTTQTQTPTASMPPQMPTNVMGGMMSSMLPTNPNLVPGSPALPVPPVNQQPASAASVASASAPVVTPPTPDTSTAAPQNVPTEMDPTSPSNVLRRRRLQRFDSKTEE